MDFVSISTERLILHRFTMGDLPLLVRLNTDPAVMRYLENAIPTPDEVGHQLRDAIDAYAEDPAPGRLAAFLREDGAFVG